MKSERRTILIHIENLKADINDLKDEIRYDEAEIREEEERLRELESAESLPMFRAKEAPHA